MQSHHQCAIIDHPHEVLEMMNVIHVKQGQGIRHASLLNPMPSVSAAVGGDTEYLIGEHEFVVHPHGVLNLRVDVK